MNTKNKLALVLTVLLLLVCLTGCMSRAVGVSVIGPSQPEPTPKPTESRPALESLEGSWRGTWEMFLCDGEWAEMDRHSWKCYAEFDADGNVLIWDEDVSKDTGLAELEIKPGAEAFRISGGRFMDNTEGFDSWTLVPNSPEGKLQLVLRGHYESKTNGSFSFAMYLEENADE